MGTGPAGTDPPARVGPFPPAAHPEAATRAAEHGIVSSVSILRDPASAASLLSPLRRSVLHALAEPGSATSVGEELGLPRQKVNYHLRALEEAGLVEHVEDRRRGNCTERIVRSTASHYLIAPTVLEDLNATPEEATDRRSGDHLAAVSARTISELAELRERASAAGKRLPTLSLEAGVRFATPDDQAAFMEGLANAVAHLVAEYHDQEADDGRWFRVTLGAHPALMSRSPDAIARSRQEDVS